MAQTGRAPSSSFRISPSILLWNCNSLPPRTSSLFTAISSYSPLIIALTECRLGSSSPPSFPHYFSFHKPRSDDPKFGGLCVYVRDCISCRRREDLEDPDIETLLLELHLPGLFLQQHIPSILLSLMYRRQSLGSSYWKKQLDHISQLVASSSPSPSSSQSVPSAFLLLGDFNNSDRSVNSSLDNFCVTHNFITYTPAFHSHPLTCTTPDFLLTNVPSLVSTPENFSLLHPLLSDHVCLCYPLSTESATYFDSRSSYQSIDWAKADWSAFSVEVADLLTTSSSSSPSSTSWLQDLSSLTTRVLHNNNKPEHYELDNIAERLACILRTASSNTLPVTTRSSGSLPWLHRPDIMKLYHEAATAARSRLSSPSLATETWFSSASMAFSRAVSSFKLATWRENSASMQRPQQIKWNILRPKSDAFNVHELQSSSPSQLCHSPVQTLDALCLHFARISSSNSDPSFLSSFQDQIETEVDSILSIPPSSSPSFSISQDDVFSALCRVRLRSAPGPDKVHYRFLRYGGPALHSALSRLFNLFLLCAYVPSSWRTADILPLYKGKGKRSDFSSYRPISLTSCICKTMERCLYPHILSIVSPQLNPSQSGFRKGHSTQFRLFSLIDCIQDSLNRRLRLPAIFLDIANAFPSVWQKGLIHKLRSLGIQDHLLRFIFSFLSDRKIQVIANGLSSSSLLLSAGVPQGSVLSPLLFLVFINDLPSILPPSVKIGLFADDIVIWKEPVPTKNDTTGESSAASILQQGLDAISLWSRKWKVLFGYSKCNVVIFHRPERKKRPSFPPMRLCGKVITPASSYKYLGLTLDECLQWREQTASILPKLQASSFSISRLISPSASPSAIVIRTLIYSFLLSILSYSLPFWHPPNIILKNRINALLADPARRFLGLPRFAPRTAILATLRLPDFDSLSNIMTLRLSRRILSLPSLASRRFRSRLSLQSPSSVPASRKPLSTKALELRQQYHIEDLSSISNSSILSSVLTSFFLSYKSEHGALPPYSATDSVSTLPLYLRTDTRATACLRSRLRLLCSHLHSHWNVRRLSPAKPPSCPLCAAPIDSLCHLLLSCRFFSSCRQNFFPRFDALAHHFPGLHFDSFIVRSCLDTLPPCPSTLHASILSLSGRFLLAINDIRNI